MTDRSDGIEFSEGPKPGPTREDYQIRLDRITALFSGMVRHAEKVSLTRCPYKNRFDQCTARFGCRFQDRSTEVDTIPCVSDDSLEYRSAWEMDPDSAEKMHDILRTGRSS